MAAKIVKGWIRRAEASDINLLRLIAKMLAAKETKRRTQCDVPISAGSLEGMIDKIKTMKRYVYGHWGHEFKVKILATPREGTLQSDE